MDWLKTSPLYFFVLSALMQSMIKPNHDHTHGRGERRLAGHGPPPGCSAWALVSTWLCLLSASQRAAEWGSIETNSLCRTQLMGLPRVGRRGAAAGLWLLILPRKHARNLPPGICPVTMTNPLPSEPTSFSVHTRIHPKILPVPSALPQGRMGDMGVARCCPQSSPPQWTRDREEEEWCSVQL